MKTANEIRLALENGNQFSNENANWYTLCKPSANRFIIVINEKTKVFANINSISKKILSLIKKGI